MATKIARTGTSSTNATKFTWSAWVKRANIGSSGMLFYNYLDANNRAYLQYYNDNLYYYDKDGGDTQAELTTAAKYKDPNAFYHICLIGDSTDGTQGDRIQLYVNGVRQTMTGTYPDASDSLGMKVHTGTNQHSIGTNADNTSNPFSGVMSHIHYVDGIDYPATTFGSTDSTTGEWKINTSPSISTSDYGNNGYFVLKDGNSVTDQSGNSHNFTVISGTLTKSEDNPSNVFATLNPLANCNTSGISLSNGNNTLTTASGGHDFSVSSLGMFSGNGKFYCEIKVSSGTNFNIVGISDHIYQGSNQEISEDNYSYGYYSDSGAGSTGGVVRGNGSNVLTSMPNYTTNDIIGIAVDLENHKLYFSKNGTWINSGDPTSGSTGTGAVSINNLNTTPNTDARGQGAYFFGGGDWYTSGGGTYQFNFGNGYFGTTAVASAGTNASGNGIFEYDVPNGYTALSTKGLNL